MSPPNVPDTTDWFNLGPEDARALDALVDAGFDIDAVPAELRERADRVARLLGQLDTPIEFGSTDLVDRTLGLVTGERLRSQSAEDEPVLCPADDDALEAWVMSGGKMPSVPGALRERARKHEALAKLVSTTPVADAGRSTDELIAATLELIENAEAGERDRMHIGSGRRLRFVDILSVAAVVLLGVSVAFPVFGNLRDGSRRAICDTNLGRVASALGIYAGANDDSLPMMTAGFGGRPWIRVGEDPKQSNSANLYVLVRNQYTDLANLACPGNPNAPTLETRVDAHDWQRLEEVSFSYQVQDGRRVRKLWDASVAVPVVADRSPVILRIVRNEPIQPEANSPNHGSRGQHIIWTDSSVSWASSPILDSRDNIWLPRSIEKIVAQARRYYGMEGNEVPDSVNDALLGP